MTHFFQCVQTSVFYYFFVQEVVGALVTHVGSGFPNEADSSLDVLSDLVEHHPHMSSFAIFLKVRVENISPQCSVAYEKLEYFQLDCTKQLIIMFPKKYAF